MTVEIPGIKTEAANENNDQGKVATFNVEEGAPVSEMKDGETVIQMTDKGPGPGFEGSTGEVTENIDGETVEQIEMKGSVE